jgi:hypothetical protein
VKTRLLFIVTAVLEAGTGVALLMSPALIVSILIEAAFDTKGDSVVGRVAGSALLSLGVACWLARNAEHSRAAIGLIKSLLLYNVAVLLILAYAGLGLRLFGIGLWPAVVLHGVMSVWCFSNVGPGRKTQRHQSGEVI